MSNNSTPSPGDNQSLEEAAEKYIDANSEWALDQNHFRVSRSFVNNLVRAAFLAGAAYVKGGSNITADVMMDVYRTVQVDGSIKEEDKLSTTFRWIYELVRESIKPSRPSIDIVDELRKANVYNGRYFALHECWVKCCDKLQELLNQSK